MMEQLSLQNNYIKAKLPCEIQRAYTGNFFARNFLHTENTCMASPQGVAACVSRDRTFVRKSGYNASREKFQCVPAGDL